MGRTIDNTSKTVLNGPHMGVDYAIVNNIDSQANRVLRHVKRALLYTLGVVGIIATTLVTAGLMINRWHPF